MYAYTLDSWDWFDDFCSHSNARHFVEYARRSNAMTPCVSSWITEGLGQSGDSVVEGSYIWCTKCSGSLGFRDGTTNAEANTMPNNCYGHFRRVKCHCQE